MLLSDPIKKTQDLVAVCRASGQWCKELQNVIVKGSGDGMWELCVLQLLQDCETRWSATNLMVNRTIDLYPVSALSI